uniref:Uncharacterized protein n=1 Tax=Panstrongylus lignarius TaxID=156445 RepID=A0A224Y266_9HEMI
MRSALTVLASSAFTLLLGFYLIRGHRSQTDLKLIRNIMFLLFIFFFNSSFAAANTATTSHQNCLPTCLLQHISRICLHRSNPSVQFPYKS